MSETLTIISTTIKQDDEGRFCLNDCHRAAGGDDEKRPSLWLRSKQAQELIAEIAENSQTSDVRNDGFQPIVEMAGNSQSTNLCFGGKQPISTIKGGNAPGTYACRELVYAYAMWINPSFHLAVIRAFDAMVQGVCISAQAPVRRAISKPRKPSLSATFQTGMRLAKTAGLEGGHAQKAAALYCEKRGLENPLDLLGVAPDRDSMGVSFGEVIFWFFQGVSNDDIQYFAQNEVPTTYRAMARDECKRRGFKIGRGRK